jgi:hypothetical protein
MISYPELSFQKKLRYEKQAFDKNSGDRRLAIWIRIYIKAEEKKP